MYATRQDDVLSNVRIAFGAVGPTVIVAQKTANNKCSMLQDIEKRRKTEIDYINGAIVYQAILNNLAAPVNDTLTKLIKGFEATYLKTY